MESIGYIVVIFAMLLSFMVIYLKQQRTIDRLNDRLMARDYREYVSTTQPRETKEKPRRKPISWYDDPDIEIEDERMN